VWGGERSHPSPQQSFRTRDGTEETHCHVPYRAERSCQRTCRSRPLPLAERALAACIRATVHVPRLWRDARQLRDIDAQAFAAARIPKRHAGRLSTDDSMVR
jgi:hypothetical protein